MDSALIKPTYKPLMANALYHSANWQKKKNIENINYKHIFQTHAELQWLQYKLRGNYNFQ